MNGATPLSSDASGTSHSAHPNDATEASLTRVLLAYLEQRINLYLRFGHPVRELRIDRWRRCAFFSSATTFCRVHWESNEYGTTRWQLLVLRTCTPPDGMQRITGVQPGARLLLRAEGGRQAAPVLQKIDAIEALRLDPATVSPAYWRTLHNRLIARMPLPAYTAERHAAYLAGEVLK
jgi:uncharacterized protein DUF2840